MMLIFSGIQKQLVSHDRKMMKSAMVSWNNGLKNLWKCNKAKIKKILANI